MLGGVLLLVLMLARLLVRTRTAHPARPTTGHATLDRLAWLSHRLIYALVLGQATAGLALAFQSGLPDIVFGHRGALPPSFWVYPARWVHFAISRLLLALIALHVTAALYHAFVLRDGLLRRMWFGARAPSEAASAAATRSSSAS
jgi:cytochrome b561